MNDRKRWIMNRFRIVVAVALALAACGGSSSTQETGTSSQELTAPHPLPPCTKGWCYGPWVECDPEPGFESMCIECGGDDELACLNSTASFGCQHGLSPRIDWRSGTIVCERHER